MTWQVFRNVAIVCALTLGRATAADYLHDIKPLLEQKCFACHGALKQQAELRVDTAVALIQGGDSGPTLTPGDPSDSLLLDVLTGAAGFTMPPESEGAKLTPDELELVRQWIAAGAPAPDDEQPQADPHQWWSYLPLRRPAPGAGTESTHLSLRNELSNTCPTLPKRQNPFGYGEFTWI